MKRLFLRLLGILCLFVLLFSFYQQIASFWQHKTELFVAAATEDFVLSEEEYRKELEKELQRRVSWFFYQGQAEKTCQFLSKNYNASACNFQPVAETETETVAETETTDTETDTEIDTETDTEITAAEPATETATKIADDLVAVNTSEWDFDHRFFVWHWQTDDFSIVAKLPLGDNWLRDTLFSQAVLRVKEDWAFGGLLPGQESEFNWLNQCGAPRQELRILVDQAEISAYSGHSEPFSSYLPSGYFYYLKPFQVFSKTFYQLLVVDAKKIRYFIRNQFLFSLSLFLGVAAFFYFLWRLRGRYVAHGLRIAFFSLISIVIFLLLCSQIAPLHTTHTRDWSRYEQEKQVLSGINTDKLTFSYHEILASLPFSSNSFYRHEGSFGSFLFHVDRKGLFGISCEADLVSSFYLELIALFFLFIWFLGLAFLVHQDRKFWAEFRYNLQKSLYEEESELVWSEEPPVDYVGLVQSLKEVFLQIQKREMQQKYLSAEIIQNFSEKFGLQFSGEQVQADCAALFFFPADYEGLEKMTVREYFKHYNYVLDLVRDCAEKFSGLSFYEEDWCHGIMFRSQGYDVSLQRALVCGLEIFRRLTETVSSCAWVGLVQKGRLSLKMGSFGKRQEVMMAGNILSRLQVSKLTLSGEQGLFVPEEFLDESHFFLFDKREMAEKPFFEIIGVHALEEHLSLLSVDDEKLQLTTLELASLRKEEWVLHKILESLDGFYGAARAKAMEIMWDYMGSVTARQIIFTYFAAKLKDAVNCEIGEFLLCLCEKSDFQLSHEHAEIVLTIDQDGLRERGFELILRRCPDFVCDAEQINKFMSSSRRVKAVYLFYSFIRENNDKAMTELLGLLSESDEDLPFILSLFGEIPCDEENKFQAWVLENPQGKELLLTNLRNCLGKNEREIVFEALSVVAKFKLREFFDLLVLQYRRCLDQEIKAEILNTLKKLGADAFIIFNLQLWQVPSANSQL